METNNEVNTPGEWLREGKTIYTLHESGQYKKGGEPILCNKFYFGIQPDYGRGITDEEGERQAEKIQTCLNEYDKLKADNAELLGALKQLHDNCLWIPKDIFTDKGRKQMQDVLEEANYAIQKAETK